MKRLLDSLSLKQVLILDMSKIISYHILSESTCGILQNRIQNILEVATEARSVKSI